MITIKDIQSAVSKLLQKNGYSVIAAEVKEGFTKPACFVDVMPVSVEFENKYSELVTVSVEISYHPAMETKEELIVNAEKLKNIFLYTPLKVKDRYLFTKVSRGSGEIKGFLWKEILRKQLGVTEEYFNSKI